MIFTRFARSAGASSLALSLALAGGAVAMTAVATPASAKEKAAKPPKVDYSKGFVAVYKPLSEAVEGEAFDAAAAQAMIPGVVAAVETPDDRLAAGNIILMVGQKANDQALQYQGIALMLDSGKVPAEKVGLLNFSAGQLAYNAKDFAKARDYVEKAVAAGYTDNDAEAFVAETYFQEDRYSEGLTYLTKLIEAKKAAGQPVKEEWVRRGLAMAYNNQMKAEALQYATIYAGDFPSKESWGDAVAIMLNTGGYQNPEILDLLRLARRTNAFKDARTYLEYLDAADYRRLPAEVVAGIDDGVAKGLLKANDPNISDTRKQAAARVAADQRDMATFLKDARAGGASLATVLAAGDTMLSMGKAAEAEELYTKALGLAGVNTPMVLTRLGIAQSDQGKFAEAQATFTKVEGARQAIASLWSAYARQKAGVSAQ